MIVPKANKLFLIDMVSTRESPVVWDSLTFSVPIDYYLTFFLFIE